MTRSCAAARYCLGNAQNGKGRIDEAIASYREAIELDPKFAAAHHNLGNALVATGRVDEAIVCYQKAIELDPNDADARTRLTQSQRMAQVRDKFAAFRKGSYTPPSNEERLGLVEWCRVQELHCTSTRLYGEAFAADPTLADNLEAEHRYSAACSAALAAAGKGADAAGLDDQERDRLRKQALDWLQAELAALHHATSRRQARRPSCGGADKADVAKRIRTSPASATVRPSRSSPRQSGKTGRRSGPRSRP